MDYLNAIRAFVMIADEHSFRGAADRLNLTRSAVSKHLAGLESHLGAQLIERTTRHVQLTEIGQNYLARCRHILAELDEAELEISTAKGEVRGALKVGAPPAFAQRHIGPHLPDFLKDYPRLQIELITTDHHIAPNETSIDLHIQISGGSLPADLNEVVLARNTRTLVASPAYLAHAGTPKATAELSRHKLITLEYGHPHNEWHFMTESGDIETYRANGSLRIDSGDAILRAALNEGGLAMLPSYVVGKHIQNGDLMAVLEEQVREDEPIRAVYRQKNHRTERIELLVDYLRTLYGEVPYWELPDASSAAAKRAAR